MTTAIERALYRGRRGDTGEWVEFRSMIQLRDGDDNLVAIGVIPMGTRADGNLEKLVDVDPATVGQWTGLFSRNGTRIFDGDEVRYIGNAKGIGWIIDHVVSVDTARVIFSFDYAGGWVVEKDGKTLNLGTRANKFEVTGTIHDGEAER